MRFVCTLLAIIFGLISLVEIFGGSFWLYRALNLLTLVCVWFALPRRDPSPEVVPAVAMELDELEELDVEEQPLPSV